MRERDDNVFDQELIPYQKLASFILRFREKNLIKICSHRIQILIGFFGGNRRSTECLAPLLFAKRFRFLQPLHNAVPNRTLLMKAWSSNPLWER